MFPCWFVRLDFPTRNKRSFRICLKAYLAALTFVAGLAVTAVVAAVVATKAVVVVVTVVHKKKRRNLFWGHGYNSTARESERERERST